MIRMLSIGVLSQAEKKSRVIYPNFVSTTKTLKRNKVRRGRSNQKTIQRKLFRGGLKALLTGKDPWTLDGLDG